MKPRLIICLFVLGMVLQPASMVSANPGLLVDPINGGTVTPSSLVSTLVGSGVSFSNVSYTGTDLASGQFSGGTGIIGFGSGIVLTSGSATNVIGPNTLDGSTSINGTPGDADLEALPGIGSGNSSDAAVLEFDFTPTTSPIYFNFVFSSEEYNEYANTLYNDVFAFFVNGTNCAMVPSTSTPVSVNTINGGNPYGTNAQNPQYFRNNDLEDGGGFIDTEMDGLTTVLTCQAIVNADTTNHLKLAIADTGDSSLDSAVFLEAGSLTTTPPDHTLSVSTSGDGGGNVNSDPSGIDCPGGEACSSQFPQGTGVTLTATADVGSVFAGWGGDCASFGTTPTCTLTMDVDHTVSAAFDPEPTIQADLSVTKSAAPDPVKAGDVLSYTIDVANAGPSDVTGVNVDDTFPSAMSGVSWTCSITTGTGTCAAASGTGNIHSTVDLTNGSTATFFAYGTVDSATTGSISNTATISSPDDTTSGNNSATAVTAITASTTPDVASGFCSGTTTCTISTNTGAGATPTDPTVSTIQMPPGADPQTITMVETSGATTTLCGGRPCSGQILTFTSNPPLTFAGVTDPTHPVVLTMIFDRSVKQGSQIYVKKDSGAPKLVPPCTVSGIASPHPCVSNKNITPTGDRRFVILFLEGDPIIGKR